MESQCWPSLFKPHSAAGCCCHKTTPRRGEDAFLCYQRLKTDQPIPGPPQEIARRGISLRAVGATAASEASSRSHALVRIRLALRRRLRPSQMRAAGHLAAADGMCPPQLALLQLVDLAGPRLTSLFEDRNVTAHAPH